MPDLEVLSPPLSTTILTLGVVFVAAAIIGGGLEAAGTKIPVITGWRRQVAAALFGLALVGFGWSALQAAYWHDDYMALVNGVSTKPPFPPETVEDRLNTLASSAGESYRRNCLVAYFIYDHNVDIPLVVKLALNKAQHTPSHALQCYIEIEAQAAKSVTTTVAAAARAAAGGGSAASAAPSPVPSSTGGTEKPGAAAGSTPQSASLPFTDPSPVPHRHSRPVHPARVPEVPVAANPTSAERILEAITRPGSTGWIYLGENAGPGQLAAKRTVLETAPRVGAPLTTTTAVHLRDPQATAKLSAAPVVGVVPRGATVTVLGLSGTGGAFTWARVQVAQEPPAGRS